MKNTGFEENLITDNQRESCSVLVMQKLLEKYSEKHNVSFDEAFSILQNPKFIISYLIMKPAFGQKVQIIF